jgi:hypothetical protein
MNWKNRMIGVMGAGVIVGCGLLSGGSGKAQAPYNPDPMQTSGPLSAGGHGPMPLGRPPDPLEAAMAARTRMERNIDRQKHLENDTKRLLVLANELKTEIASAGTETMTPEMLRKMDEIEKLARSVKDKMRD